MPHPFVSVIIPAYNAEATIGKALTALAAQTYPGSLEVIVADDGSADGTRAAVEKHPNVKYVFQPNAGPASARNLGAGQAEGEFLLFTDSDCCPEPAWVEKMLAGFSHTDIAAVAGSYGIANPQSLLARIIHREILWRHEKLMPEYTRAFGGYNFAIRRSIFETVGGFNVSYRRASGEDNDLSYKVLKAGGRIRFLRTALVDHYHQTDIGKYLREQFRHGRWRVLMYIDHPHMVMGDGYTFWKDMLEVPLAGFSLGSLLVALGPGLALGACFFGFEAVFGFLMIGRAAEGLAAGLVFWLRAYARTLGFLVGGLQYIIYLLRTRK